MPYLSKDHLTIALPTGSLELGARRLFSEAQVVPIDPERIDRANELTFPELGITIVRDRPQDMTRSLRNGIYDLAVTGEDCIVTDGGGVYSVAPLGFSRSGTRDRPTRWVLAVRQDGPIKEVQELTGGIVATENPRLVRAYLWRHGAIATIELSHGATEAKMCRADVNAIGEVVDSGASLRANRLRELAEIFRSSSILAASPLSMENDRKRERIELIAAQMEAVMIGRGKRMIEFNARNEDLPTILGALESESADRVPIARATKESATKAPKVAAKKGWSKSAVLVDADRAFQLAAIAKKLGASSVIISEPSAAFSDNPLPIKLIDPLARFGEDFTLTPHFDPKKVQYGILGNTVPTIIQDEISGAVVMLGYANKAAIEKMVKEKIVHLYSPKHDGLWSESDGPRISEIQANAAGDVLLVKVRDKRKQYFLESSNPDDRVLA